MEQDWMYFSDKLPLDKQRITVYDSGLNAELKRMFFLKFWQDNNRVLFCSSFCKKWKPI